MFTAVWRTTSTTTTCWHQQQRLMEYQRCYMQRHLRPGHLRWSMGEPPHASPAMRFKTPTVRRKLLDEAAHENAQRHRQLLVN
jgi:hypothetical protein